MSGKAPAVPDSGYDATFGSKINMPNRPRSARSPSRPFSAGRRTPVSVERPRTAGRVPSHVTVATQDVQKSAGMSTISDDWVRNVSFEGVLCFVALLC